MILAAHCNMSEEAEEWSSRLRFTGVCQTVNNVPDLNLSDNLHETTEQQHYDGIKQKRRILEKRVSFPSDETMLVQNLEPTVPDVPECVATETETDINIVAAYTSSCKKNEAEPVEHIIEQLKTLDLSRPRSASLTLRGRNLNSHDCESLEDVLKNVPLKLLDIGDAHSSDDGLIALFDMIEFYEAATHVSIASNKNMTSRGWQACCRMIKRTECLEWLDAAQVGLSEHSSTLLARALRSNSRLRVLYLNDCGLTGRSLAIIASSLKMNRNLRELHLAENKLTPFDALQLGILLTGNSSLQHVDLRNNEILDKGMGYICDALLDNVGLISLVVWNNGITQESSPALAKVLATNQTLQTLNLGHNKLGDDGIINLIPSGLERNRSLLLLGLQENGLTCPGIISLSESLATGTKLKRIDLRKNSIGLAGLMALAAALKHCPTISQVDLDTDNHRNVNSSTSSPDQQQLEHNTAEYRRLTEEIATLCAAHETEANDSDTLSSLPSDLNKQSTNITEEVEMANADDVASRKISLTCLVPPSEKLLLLPLNNEDDQQPRVPRKLRSPLPSPSPSPSPSPLPSPSGGRFKVTRVEANNSPLPSPRSRFTVTPVAFVPRVEEVSTETGETADVPSSDSVLSSSNNNSATETDNSIAKDDKTASSDYTSLIRSSPSKVIVGFDVLTT